jgi:hypothetical protein
MHVLYWIILAVILTANLWAQHDFEAGHGEPFHLMLAGGLGRLAGALLLPIIVWAIVSIKRRDNKPSLLAYCAIGGAITTILALFGSYSDYKSMQKDPELTHPYSVEGCKFIVSFPAMPKEQMLYAPGIGAYKQAGFSTKNAYLRMECTSVTYTRPREQSREALEKYAEAEGFMGTTIQPVTNSSDALWEMRGYKKVDSVPVTFKFRLFYANGSVMILLVSIPSKDYPLPIEEKFFSSVRRK